MKWKEKRTEPTTFGDECSALVSSLLHGRTNSIWRCCNASGRLLSGNNKCHRFRLRFVGYRMHSESPAPSPPPFLCRRFGGWRMPVQWRPQHSQSNRPEQRPKEPVKKQTNLNFICKFYANVKEKRSEWKILQLQFAGSINQLECCFDRVMFGAIL